MCSRKIFMPTYSPFLFLILSPLEMRAGALALPLFGYNYRCVLQSCLTLRSRCWMTITGQVSKLALQARSLRGFTQHCTAWAIHSAWMRCRRRRSKGVILQVQSSPRSLSSSDSRGISKSRANSSFTQQHGMSASQGESTGQKGTQALLIR